MRDGAEPTEEDRARARAYLRRFSRSWGDPAPVAQPDRHEGVSVRARMLKPRVVDVRPERPDAPAACPKCGWPAKKRRRKG